MTGEERTRVLDAARDLVGTPFDFEHDAEAWKDLSTSPTSLDSTAFVCRVAAEAGLYRTGLLVPDATWLLDHFVATQSPSLGDIVGYMRRSTADEVELHLMIYAGTGHVIGACDLSREVTIRPLEYEEAYGDRRWHLLQSPPFRVLHVIF